ncbi:MAG: hypothetical protein U7126_20760 [Microcoleus sp.]
MLTLKMASQKIQQFPPEQLNISVQSLPEAKLAIEALLSIQLSQRSIEQFFNLKNILLKIPKPTFL